MLRDVVTNDNTASDVWADTAYRSQSNERWLKSQGRVSRIHRRKPKGKPMPANIRRGNATKSSVRARVEHVFAHQKAKMGLFIRTIGIKRAEAKITLTNLTFNITAWSSTRRGRRDNCAHQRSPRGRAPSPCLCCQESPVNGGAQLSIALDEAEHLQSPPATTLTVLALEEDFERRLLGFGTLGTSIVRAASSVDCKRLHQRSKSLE